jgi:glyoxylase-like metal-dependent hydrolase (beta-lactamase superfamily II)
VAPFTETLDLMGDGSLMLLLTPGHTAGSVSLLVRRADGPPLLLTGDLTYGAELMCRGQLPGVGRRRQLAASTRKVLALARRHPGLVTLPAHDPTAARQLLESEPGGPRSRWPVVQVVHGGAVLARPPVRGGTLVPSAACLRFHRHGHLRVTPGPAVPP